MNSRGIKATWHRLKEGSPGSRFQDEYRAHEGNRRGKWGRVLWMGVGVVIVAVGIVGLPAPGPGFLVIAIGAALLARESLVVARATDWVELRLRQALKWARAWWKDAALAARAAVALCALALAGLTGYLAYLRFFT